MLLLPNLYFWEVFGVPYEEAAVVQISSLQTFRPMTQEASMWTEPQPTKHPTPQNRCSEMHESQLGLWMSGSSEKWG